MPKGLIRCSSCGTEMVREYDDGKKKLRASILIWENDKCFGKCRKCGNDVALQLSLVIPAVTKIKKRPVHVVFSVDRSLKNRV